MTTAKQQADAIFEAVKGYVDRRIEASLAQRALLIIEAELNRRVAGMDASLRELAYHDVGIQNAIVELRAPVAGVVRDVNELRDQLRAQGLFKDPTAKR